MVGLRGGHSSGWVGVPLPVVRVVRVAVRVSIWVPPEREVLLVVGGEGWSADLAGLLVQE